MEKEKLRGYMRKINLFLTALILTISTAHARSPYDSYRMPSSGNLPGWGKVDLANGTTGTLAIANGGTGQTSANAALNALLPSQATHGGKCLSTDGSNTSWASVGTGSVTSVDLAVPAEFSLSGNPITTSGTITISKASQSQNLFYASPDGSSGVPTFRAIVAADVPTLNQNTTGTASNVTGTVAVANGGTGSTSLTANNVLLGNGTSALQVVAPGTSGNVLTSNGTTWTSAAPSVGTGLLNASFTLEGATVPYTTIGGTHYQTGTQSLTAVYISALNSGTSGSTQIRVNQYRSGSLLSSATASLSASSGNPNGANASLSGTLSLLAGDIITVDVVSVAGGTPENITVEY